jgi:hypothetical protein
VYLALVIVCHAVYLALIGGDFMEFRMLDVVLPMAYLLTAVQLVGVWNAGRPLRRPAVVAAVLAIAAGNGYANATIENRQHHVVTRHVLAELTTDYWVVIGQWFARRALSGESIATTAAGAIPYYSGLRCVDMMGLADASVARLPPDPNERIGHRKIAPKSYLAAREITFVVGHPQILHSPTARSHGPDRFIVEIENDNRRVNGGRDFYLMLGTTVERDSLLASLRRRGVNVRE